jgi:hypothetical protein
MEGGAAATTFAGTENPTPIARRSCETLRRGPDEREADEFSGSFGPIVTLLETLEPERAAAFRADLIALFDDSADAGGEVVLDRPYLLVKGTRR